MNDAFRTNIEEFKIHARMASIKIPGDEIVAEYDAISRELNAEVDGLLIEVSHTRTEAGCIVETDDVPKAKARVIIRSMFAAIEGTVFGLKQLAYASSTGTGPLKLDELLLCRELEFKLNDKGEVVGTPAHLKLESNLKFAFSALAKAYHLDFKLDLNSPGWNDLLHSIKIRNRLAHPKKTSDLEVNGDDLHRAIGAFKWFRTQRNTLFDTMEKQIETSAKYIETMCRQLKEAVNKRADVTTELHPTDDRTIGPKDDR